MTQLDEAVCISQMGNHIIYDNLILMNDIYFFKSNPKGTKGESENIKLNIIVLEFAQELQFRVSVIK